MNSKEVEIRNTSGDVIKVELMPEEDRAHSCLMIDRVRYHFERVTRAELVTDYKVDADPDYSPQSDAGGYCYLLAPYSE